MTDTTYTGNTDQPRDSSIWSASDPGTIDLNQLWNELQDNPLAVPDELTNPPHPGDGAASGQPASDTGEDWSTDALR